MLVPRRQQVAHRLGEAGPCFLVQRGGLHLFEQLLDQDAPRGLLGKRTPELVARVKEPAPFYSRGGREGEP